MPEKSENARLSGGNFTLALYSDPSVCVAALFRVALYCRIYGYTCRIQNSKNTHENDEITIDNGRLFLKIWVDADACPVVIKEILFKAAERTGIQLTLVANQAVRVPPSRYISSIQVSSGFDVADNEIVKRVERGDLVITGDIPLADEVIKKGGEALSPRGERYTADNIKARLNIRDFLDTLRGSGIDTGGPPALNQADRKAFADHLDRILAKYARTT